MDALSKKKTRMSALGVVAATIAGMAVAAGVSLGAHAAGAFAAEVYRAPSSGSWTVDSRGNGHGHGLSQYGARGAAIAGLNVSKILAFYYPGTVLTTLPASYVRVWVTDQGSSTTVRAGAGLSVTGVAGHLPTANINRWRLVPSGAGLALQRLTSGSWVTAKTGLPSTATFSSSTGVVDLYHGDGSFTAYRGTISAVRSGSGEIAVNRLSLDNYVRGVIPREMPSSWQPAAVQAQAVAARTYARYEITHSGGGAYDICDTTNCQVYGGMMRYSAGGTALYGEEPGSNAAVAATANKVLTYKGSTAFAQFSASDGGVMSAGGQPYLVGKADPYDNSASGDPYLATVSKVSPAQIAGYYGLAKVTEIDITGRAGGGTWGGVVTTATVRGTNSAGTARAVPTTGLGLAAAMNLNYALFRLRAVATMPSGHVDSITMETVLSYRVVGWTFDPKNSAVSTRVHVYVDAGGRSFTANLPRTDVKTTFGTASALHGFSVVVPIPATGTHKLCVYGMDVASLHHTTILCKLVTAPSNPLGHVEAIARAGTSYRLSGWAFDPNRRGGPGRVFVFVDGTVRAFDAARLRTDVARRYALTTANVGFIVSVPVPAGTHRICTYSINLAGPGSHVSIGCVTVRR